MNDTFIITGDISAMWLRDSTNQVQPYLRFLRQDPGLQKLVAGLIARQASFVQLDPYANAFQLGGSLPSPHLGDSTSKPGFAGTRLAGMGPQIFERKFEVDSLVNFLALSAQYWSASGDVHPFQQLPWQEAVSAALSTLRTAQQGTAEDLSGNSPYYFQRQTSQPTDTLQFGRGWPAASIGGLLKTAFRPSDDAHLFPYHIPDNAFACATLERLQPLLKHVGLSSLADEATSLAKDIRSGLETYGRVTHPTAGTVWAYEVDGYGNAVMMDDANLPSLLGLPLSGFVNATDPLYRATRAAVWSSANPYFYNGTAGEGIGGPHVGFGQIWPMSIITRAMTSTSDAEISACLDALVESSACTGLLHESFNKDDPGSFTRRWFAWANSYFGELILKLAEERTHLIFKSRR